MKSETAETDRTKIESRQSIHRRKMSKNSSIVNGADESLSYAAEDESVVSQTLAAALHDHLSCAKSYKIDGSRETKVSQPCETDHIYANCSEMKNKSPIVNVPVIPTTTNLTIENKKMQNLLIIQMEIIKQLEHDLILKNKLLKECKHDSNSSKGHLYRKDHMSLLRNHHKSENVDTNISQVRSIESEVNNTTSTVTSTTVETTYSFAAPATTSVPNEHSSIMPSVNLVTRYFGRRSKTIPSRALKRRYLGPPKTIPFKKPPPVSLSSTTSVSSESEVHEDEMLSKVEVPKETKPVCEKSSIISIKKINKKRSKRLKILFKRMEYLKAEKAYYLPCYHKPPSFISPGSEVTVPLWTIKNVSSFYQMEGTENITDPVFIRRHTKIEIDEKRRKRWDIQRLREQKASEKLKHKYCRDAGKRSEILSFRSRSFIPDPMNALNIIIVPRLPVNVFGNLVPVFQPSNFSLSLNCDSSLFMRNHLTIETYSNNSAKKRRLSSTEQKFT